MPPEYTYPGVYVQEIPANLQAINPVPTSIASLIGRTRIGPTEVPTLVTSFMEFEQKYGGLWAQSPLSYAVRHFFDNKGQAAWIARIVHGTDETAPVTDADLSDPALEPAHRGLWLFDQADEFNLLCIPPLSPATDVAKTSWNAAIAYATRRRAFVIADAPAAWTTVAHAIDGLDAVITRDANASLYFPRIEMPDPLNGGAPRSFAPSGAIAGLYARTDTSRGIWKAPAGTTAALLGVTGLTTTVDSRGNKALNRAGINALRHFPTKGHLVWGARTLVGADSRNSEWKYVPVRRLALYIEESIRRGTQWVVFEPNAYPLWAQLVRQVDAFLQALWRQGAFQGATPNVAYFVKCSPTTMTPADIAAGRVILQVGFAALKPGEFFILRFELQATKPT